MAVYRISGDLLSSGRLVTTVNRRPGMVEDESELAYTMMDLFMELMPVVVCSLIRFNDQQQALPVIHQ